MSAINFKLSKVALAEVRAELEVWQKAITRRALKKLLKGKRT